MNLSTCLHGAAKWIPKVVDDARLLGERLLWFAGRYPYLIGEQTELTFYRLLDQPEGIRLMEAIGSIQRLSESLTGRIATIQGNLEKQQTAFFSKISKERAAMIEQLHKALKATAEESIDHAAESIRIPK